MNNKAGIDDATFSVLIASIIFLILGLFALSIFLDFKRDISNNFDNLKSEIEVHHNMMKCLSKGGEWTWFQKFLTMPV